MATPQIMIPVPDGASLKGMAFNIPDGATIKDVYFRVDEPEPPAEKHIPKIESAILGAGSSAQYCYIYIGLDEYTFNNLSSDPITVSISYKKYADTTWSSPTYYTAFSSIDDTYRQIGINNTNVPHTGSIGAKVIISNSQGTSEEFITYLVE